MDERPDHSMAETPPKIQKVIYIRFSAWYHSGISAAAKLFVAALRYPSLPCLGRRPETDGDPSHASLREMEIVCSWLP